MAIISKKDSRKASKGKSTDTPVAKKAKIVAAPVEEVESDEDEDEEDEDEENGGVSEKGMKRLMELVGEEDLDDLEKARLVMEDGDEDEDEDEEDDEDFEDEEDVSGDEEVSEGEEESDEEEEDEEEGPVDTNGTSIIIDPASPSAVPLDDMGSEYSLDEDAVPVRKVTANNKPAMKILRDGLQVTSLPWLEHLTLSSKETVDVDPSDDLNRELAFYKIALDQVAVARKLCAKNDIPFSRPHDYYAEMVKSDEHMERVRTKLVEEAQGIKKSESAKKQRDLKKYGKQIQVEKLKSREQEKKNFSERMQGVKRKRKDGVEIGGEGDGDDFNIAVEHAMEDRPSRNDRGGRGGRGRGGDRGGSKMPRSARDSKYSLGGSSRRAKQNDKESSNDFAGWSGGGGRGGSRGRGGSGGGRGGRGGSGGGRGGRGGSGGTRGGNRPGKSRRTAGRA